MEVPRKEKNVDMTLGREFIKPKFLYKVYDDTVSSVAHLMVSGAANDERDGFLHLSTERQLETILKKFKGKRVTVYKLCRQKLEELLGRRLRLELYKDQELFYHAYVIGAELLNHRSALVSMRVIEVEKEESAPLESKNVDLQVQFSIADHGGYCSGNECELQEQCTVLTLPVSRLLRAWLDAGNDIDDYPWMQDSTYADNIKQYAKENINLNTTGSCYCDLSNECAEKGLSRHDWRIAQVCANLVRVD